MKLTIVHNVNMLPSSVYLLLLLASDDLLWLCETAVNTLRQSIFVVEAEDVILLALPRALGYALCVFRLGGGASREVKAVGRPVDALKIFRERWQRALGVYSLVYADLHASSHSVPFQTLLHHTSGPQLSHSESAD